MFITWDPATKEGDYSCKIYWRKGKYGNVYIENVEYFKSKKEVKKVDKIPYFELKVVKVKKQLKDSATIFNQCPICKEIHKCNFKKESKGNYVNGENLDKIKFPCFCSYNGKYRGMIFVEKDNSYGLINIDKQREKWNIEDNGWCNLANMINSYDIHILKGKIILFEERE